MNKILTSALIVLALSSCKDNDSGTPDPIVSNIVTYEATTEDGSVSTFSFQAVDDSPLITISANWKAPAELKPGTRLLAYYTTTTPNESGPVELKSLVQIPGGTPKDTTAITNLTGEELGLQAMWRSGSYLNLNAGVYFTGQASEVSLLVDTSTLQQPEVDTYVYIGHNPDSPVDGTTATRMLVASWNIADIWTQPTLQTLRVTYRDLRGQPQTMKFTKKPSN